VPETCVQRLLGPVAVPAVCVQWQVCACATLYRPVCFVAICEPSAAIAATTLIPTMNGTRLATLEKVLMLAMWRLLELCRPSLYSRIGKQR
jgi:hypothetical protein